MLSLRVHLAQAEDDSTEYVTTKKDACDTL